MTTRPKRPGPSVQKVPAVSEVPVTRNMLMGVRDELAARLDQHAEQFRGIDARFAQVDARFAQVDARFEQIDARFAQVDARFEQIDARFAQVDARIDEVRAEVRELRHEIESFRAEVRGQVARIGALVEEQEVRNRVVLEVVQGHNARFERIEAEQRAQGDMLREILAAVTKRS
ncbi:MAG: hypothetical protein U0324_24640 [Polyangiales bacterium]